MKNTFCYIVLLAAVLFTACESPEPQPQPQPQPIGDDMLHRSLSGSDELLNIPERGFHKAFE